MTFDSVVSPPVLNKYLILVDKKNRRFKYQSGRAGDKAKKRKSPAKSGRVGIYVIVPYIYIPVTLEITILCICPAAGQI